jgi:hypothetical protein
MVSKSAIPTATLDMRKSTQKSSVEHISAAKHTASNLLQVSAGTPEQLHITLLAVSFCCAGHIAVVARVASELLL